MLPDIALPGLRSKAKLLNQYLPNAPLTFLLPPKDGFRACEIGIEAIEDGQQCWFHREIIAELRPKSDESERYLAPQKIQQVGAADEELTLSWHAKRSEPSLANERADRRRRDLDIVGCLLNGQQLPVASRLLVIIARWWWLFHVDHGAFYGFLSVRAMDFRALSRIRE